MSPLDKRGIDPVHSSVSTQIRNFVFVRYLYYLLNAIRNLMSVNTFFV